VSYFDQDTA